MMSGDADRPEGIFSRPAIYETSKIKTKIDGQSDSSCPDFFIVQILVFDFHYS